MWCYMKISATLSFFFCSSRWNFVPLLRNSKELLDSRKTVLEIFEILLVNFFPPFPIVWWTNKSDIQWRSWSKMTEQMCVKYEKMMWKVGFISNDNLQWIMINQTNEQRKLLQIAIYRLKVNRLLPPSLRLRSSP